MHSRSENQGRMILAVILIGLGVVLLLGQLFDFSLIGTFWPFIIILPGLVFLYFAVKGEPGMAALAIPRRHVTGTGAILLFSNGPDAGKAGPTSGRCTRSFWGWA